MWEALALHGKLVFIASIFRLIRPLFPSTIHFSNSFHNPRARLHTTRSLRKDLQWIKYLVTELDILPVVIPLSTPDLVDLDWSGMMPALRPRSVR